MESNDDDAKSISERKKEFRQITEGLVRHIILTKRTDYYVCAAEYFSNLLRLRERTRRENTEKQDEEKVKES